MSRASASDLCRRRALAGAAAALVVLAGILVQASSSTASDVAGDALYAALAYLLVVLLAPAWPEWRAGVVAAAWCIAVELLQLTGLPAAWAAAFPPVRFVLGTAFDARDVVVYAVAAAVCAALDAGARRLGRR